MITVISSGPVLIIPLFRRRRTYFRGLFFFFFFFAGHGASVLFSCSLFYLFIFCGVHLFFFTFSVALVRFSGPFLKTSRLSSQTGPTRGGRFCVAWLFMMEDRFFFGFRKKKTKWIRRTEKEKKKKFTPQKRTARNKAKATAAEKKTGFLLNYIIISINKTRYIERNAIKGS